VLLGPRPGGYRRRARFPDPDGNLLALAKFS
jgi:hypothetical protein